MIRIQETIPGVDILALSQVRARYFQVKLLICVCLVMISIALIVLAPGILWLAPAFVLGLMYAHAVELQHQCLHNTAYRSKRWNRIVGVLLGLPTLVSFSDYQSSHLEHHRLLGTPENREFFNYGYEKLTSLRWFLPHLFMVRHYQDVVFFILRAIVGGARKDKKHAVAQRIRTEYQLMAVFLVGMAVITYAFQTVLFLKIWFIPLLVAIPTHCLIELPEHIGCQGDTLDVLNNTRTIKASKFGVWFVDGNNYHVEHHWLPSVPNDRFPDLNNLIASRIRVAETSYWSFYRKFFKNLYTRNVRAVEMWGR